MTIETIDKLADREEDALASEIEAMYRLDQGHRRPFEAVWYENLSFYGGDQYIRWDVAAGELRRIPSTQTRYGYLPRPRTNYVLKNVRALVANLLKSDPRVMVRARGTGDEDQTAARIAEKVVECLDELTNWDEKLVELVFWMVVTGCAFRKDYLDSTEMAKVVVPRSKWATGLDGEPILDATGKPVEQKPAKSPAEYVVQRSILSPFQMMVDPLASRLDDASWVCEFSIQRCAWIRELFDQDRPGFTGRVKEVQPESGVSPGLLYFLQLKHYYTGRVTQFEDAAILKEWYQAPTPKHPYGRCVIVASGIPLYVGPSPYMPKFWHPYTMFSYLPFPGRFWPLSAVEMLVPCQRKLNSIDAFRMVYRNTMAAPRIFLPKGSGVPRDHITGAPGQIIEYNASSGGKPDVMDGRPLPPDITQERQETVADMEQIAGTFDILSGDRPKGVPSYSGLAFLQENASDAHNVTYRLFEKSLERSQTKALQLVGMYYTEDRPELTALLKEKLARGSSAAEIHQFIGAELGDNCDVRVETGSAIPQSRVLYQQTILEFVGRGLLQDVFMDPEKKQQLFELFGMADFSSVDSIDVRKAQLENAIFLQAKEEDAMAGTVDALFLPEDDHQIHLFIVNRLLKDPKSFEKGPWFIDMLRNHSLMHQMALQQQMMQQQAAAPAGAPGEAGPPSSGAGAPAPSSVAISEQGGGYVQ